MRHVKKGIESSSTGTSASAVRMSLRQGKHIQGTQRTWDRTKNKLGNLAIRVVLFAEGLLNKRV